MTFRIPNPFQWHWIFKPLQFLEFVNFGSLGARVRRAKSDILVDALDRNYDLTVRSIIVVTYGFVVKHVILYNAIRMQVYREINETP